MRTIKHKILSILVLNRAKFNSIPLILGEFVTIFFLVSKLIPSPTQCHSFLKNQIWFNKTYLGILKPKAQSHQADCIILHNPPCLDMVGFQLLVLDDFQVGKNMSYCLLIIIKYTEDIFPPYVIWSCHNSFLFFRILVRQIF